jgi:hypothetical protein
MKRHLLHANSPSQNMKRNSIYDNLLTPKNAKNNPPLSTSSARNRRSTNSHFRSRKSSTKEFSFPKPKNRISKFGNKILAMEKERGKSTTVVKKVTKRSQKVKRKAKKPSGGFFSGVLDNMLEYFGCADAGDH